jgi:hypothetical protein
MHEKAPPRMDAGDQGISLIPVEKRSRCGGGETGIVF